MGISASDRLASGKDAIDSQMKYSNSQSVTGPTGEVMLEGTKGELVGLLD